MVKHLGLAAGYGHLRYAPLGWQPVPVDRAINVDIQPAWGRASDTTGLKPENGA